MTEVIPSRMFVVIEGNEGSGKTTLINAIRNSDRLRGIDAVFTREPGGTQLAEELRFIAKGRRSEVVSPVADLLMVQAARTQNIDNVIRPALKAGKWVFTDRFIQSTWCLNVAPFLDTYQHLPDVFMGLMPHVLGHEIPEPIVFIVTVPEEIRLERVAARPDEDDRYAERSIETLTRTAAAYQSISQGPNTIVVDGTLPTEEQVEFVFETLWAFKAKLDEEREAQLAREQQVAEGNTETQPTESDEEVQPEFALPEGTEETPVEQKPFDLETAIEEYAETNVIPELFEGNAELVPYYKELAKKIVRVIYRETGEDVTIFHPMRVGELNRQLHSMFHFGEQLAKWKDRVRDPEPAETEVAVSEAKE